MAQSMKKRKGVFKILAALARMVLFSIPVLALIYYFEIHHTNGELISSGVKRTYLLHVPPNYQPDRPTPLVITIHGYADWPAHQMENSHWNQVADENNFIVVYPTGTGTPLHWRASGQAGTQVDVQFFSDLIDQLEQQYNIDPTRIFVNGHSNGGGMSFVLSCKLSGRIAAFGSVSGAYLLPWTECNPQRQLPAIIFHGTHDQTVPFVGGPSKYFNQPFPVITDWVRALAAKNGCSETPLVLPAQGEVSGVQYTSGTHNADVIFYTITNGGHSWPGGRPLPPWMVGHTTQDVDATRLMWQFFQRHPMGK